MRKFTINVYLVSIRWRRKAAFLQRLAAAELPDNWIIEYKHINCVDASQHSSLPGKTYDSWITTDAPEHLKKWWGQPITQGEIGCFLSHLSAIQNISKSKADLNIIFEDDATIGGSLFPILERIIPTLPTNWDCLYLGRNQVNKELAEKNITPFIVEPSFSYQTHAIAWTAEAAQKVMDNIDEIMQNQIPFDELLPTLFGSHPREDLNQLFSLRLNAYAAIENLSKQVNDNIHDTF